MPHERLDAAKAFYGQTINNRGAHAVSPFRPFHKRFHTMFQGLLIACFVSRPGFGIACLPVNPHSVHLCPQRARQSPTRASTSTTLLTTIAPTTITNRQRDGPVRETIPCLKRDIQPRQ